MNKLQHNKNVISKNLKKWDIKKYRLNSTFFWKRLRAEFTKYFDCQSLSHNLIISDVDFHKLKTNCVLILHNRSYVVRYRAEKIFKHACTKKTIHLRLKKIIAKKNMYKC